jgi:hypothetical protein
VGAGAREESVSSMEEVYALLNRGSAVRTTSNTLMNEVGPPPNAWYWAILGRENLAGYSVGVKGS